MGLTLVPAREQEGASLWTPAAPPRAVDVALRRLGDWLMRHQRVIRAAFEHSGPGMGVCWLPPYHDMGLVGGVLQVVFHGAACMLMSPLVLLQRPLRWCVRKVRNWER